MAFETKQDHDLKLWLLFVLSDCKVVHERDATHSLCFSAFCNLMILFPRTNNDFIDFVGGFIHVSCIKPQRYLLFVGSSYMYFVSAVPARKADMGSAHHYSRYFSENGSRHVKLYRYGC